MRAITFAVGVAAALAGCQDPEISITVDFPDEVVPPCVDEPCRDVSLVKGVERLEVSVYEFASHYCAIDPADPRSNDDVPFGRVSAEVEDESRRSRVVLHRDAGVGALALSGVPRLGHKVVTVMGYDEADQPLAGGCADVGDIDDDLALTIPVERTLIVRVLPSPLVAPSLRLPTDGGATLSVFAQPRRLDSAVPPDDALQVWLRAAPDAAEVEHGGLRAERTPQEIENRLFTIEDLDAPVPAEAIGPVELVVRGRWADQVNRVSANVRADLVGGVSLEDVDGPNQVAPSWAVFERNPPRDVVAVARYRGDSGALQLVVAREINGALVRGTAVDAPGVRSLTVFRGGSGPQVVTRTATGWVTVRWDVEPAILVPGLVETTVAADQLVGLPPNCGTGDVGILGVVGGRVLGWHDVDGSAPSGNDNDVGRLAANLDSLGGSGVTLELLGPACLVVRNVEGNPVERWAVAVRRTALGREDIYLATPDAAPLLTQFVGGVSVAPSPQPTILAVTMGPAGPRVGTYRLRYEAGQAAVVIPDGNVDHPLPTAAIAVAAVRQGEVLDTLGLHALDAQPGSLGLSMTRGSVRRGNELSAMTVVGAGGADHHLLRIGFSELPDGTPGRDEVMIAGDNGLLIYDLTKVERMPMVTP